MMLHLNDGEEVRVHVDAGTHSHYVTLCAQGRTMHVVAHAKKGGDHHDATKKHVLTLHDGDLYVGNPQGRTEANP